MWLKGSWGSQRQARVCARTLALLHPVLGTSSLLYLPSAPFIPTLLPQTPFKTLKFPELPFSVSHHNCFLPLRDNRLSLSYFLLLLRLYLSTLLGKVTSSLTNLITSSQQGSHSISIWHAALCPNPVVKFFPPLYWGPLSGLFVLSPAVALSYVLGLFLFTRCTLPWKVHPFPCSPSLWSIPLVSVSKNVNTFLQNHNAMTALIQSVITVWHHGITSLRSLKQVCFPIIVYFTRKITCISQHYNTFPKGTMKKWKSN